MTDRVLYRLNAGNILDHCSDDDDDDNWHSSDDEQDGTKAMNNANAQRIEDLPWFHGDMSRNTAEALLLVNSKEGTYLMRNSGNNPGGYTVSVRCRDSIKHYSLEFNQYTNTYKFGMGQFEKLEELIEHFQCMPVLGSAAGISVTLKFPYLKNVAEPTAYEKVTRHAEYGKTSSISERQKACAPDLHIASKEGFLTKRGALHKNWKKRWFVLQKNTLRYYANEKASTHIREIDLRDAHVATEDFIDGKTNCFRLVTTSRIFYFDASSSSEARSWIDMLAWKIDYYKNRQVERSNSNLSSSLEHAGNVATHAAYLSQYTKKL